MRVVFCLVALVPVLLSCSSSSGGVGTSPEFCNTVSGSSTNTSSIATSCANCSIDNRDQAIDDNLGTAATMHVGAGSAGELALRVNAQSGIVYAADSRPGFVIADSDDDSLPFVRTFLDGNYQEDSKQVHMAASSNGQTLVFFNATKQFNSIEAVLPGDSAVVGAQNRSISVYEFCVQ